ncbi:MAG: endonuclease MutS2, partial [Chloroflexi bacterium]|nr:endonuclease MutS2 [Chloroflexota bacterium]
ASRRLAQDLAPLADVERISTLLRQSAEARRLLEKEPGFSIGGIFDIRELAGLAARGKVLDPENLLEIQRTLGNISQLRSRLRAFAADCPLLWGLAEKLASLNDLEKDIARRIAPGGELFDNASPALAEIRAGLRETRQQLDRRLQAIIDSPRGRRIIQEPIITEREGRHVILVKAEFKHEIKGIVHDISNTGATAFIEPWATVELGNILRERTLEERREIEKILARLSIETGAYETEIAENIGLVAELDLALAKARYARAWRAAEPVVSVFDGAGSGVLKLAEARHPLLGDKAVPLSVEIGRDFTILVITGPNTGGKTVALKTIGLLSLMTQAGLPIPASPDSRVPLFDDIFADIGDEQSIEQTLSTFSWHIGNIVRFINRTTRRSLVLLDELGTSTDPAEGSALARAILRHFQARGALAVATTHFNDLKVFAHTAPGLQNASLDFDPVTLAPTYHLTVGIPGGSNALATAARLGLPGEIIESARGMLARGTEELESLLATLIQEKQKTETLAGELSSRQHELESRKRELDDELLKLKTEERRAITELRDQAVREAAELHREIQQAVAGLRKERSKQAVEQARETMAAVRKRLDTGAWKPAKEAAEASAARIVVGDPVKLKETSLEGTVVAVSEDDRRVEVQAGQTRLSLGLDSVEKITGSKTAAVKPPVRVRRAAGSGPVARELDLRGKRADEVEALLDGYLNEASLAGLREVRIIHGFGTGTVRKIARDFLASHPLVRSFRSGQAGEGGDGATVVQL